MTTFVFNVHCILLSHLTCKILTLKDYNIFKWERFFLNGVQTILNECLIMKS